MTPASRYWHQRTSCICSFGPPEITWDCVRHGYLTLTCCYLTWNTNKVKISISSNTLKITKASILLMFFCWGRVSSRTEVSQQNCGIFSFKSVKELKLGFFVGFFQPDFTVQSSFSQPWPNVSQTFHVSPALAIHLAPSHYEKSSFALPDITVRLWNLSIMC